MTRGSKMARIGQMFGAESPTADYYLSLFTCHLLLPRHIRHSDSQRTLFTMPRGASPKREREYAEIEEKIEKEGRYKGREKEVAARIVNKQRAQAGETKKSTSTARKPSKKKR
jgi:hypothetical protein